MPGPPPSFAQLIARCTASAGDHEAWSLLFEQQNGFLHHWAVRYLARGGLLRQNQVDPEDVCMDIWQRLLRDDRRALSRFSGREQGAFRAYLKSAILHHVIDLKRRSRAKGRDKVHPMDPEQLAMTARSDGASSPLRQLTQRDLCEKAKAHLITRWVDNPNARRDLLIYSFHFEDGVSAARIADLPSVELTRGGVEKVILRIRKLLHELADSGDELEAEGAS